MTVTEKNDKQPTEKRGAEVKTETTERNTPQNKETAPSSAIPSVKGDKQLSGKNSPSTTAPEKKKISSKNVQNGPSKSNNSLNSQNYSDNHFPSNIKSGPAAKSHSRSPSPSKPKNIPVDDVSSDIKRILLREQQHPSNNSYIGTTAPPSTSLFKGSPSIHHPAHHPTGYPTHYHIPQPSNYSTTPPSNNALFHNKNNPQLNRMVSERESNYSTNYNGNHNGNQNNNYTNYNQSPYYNTECYNTEQEIYKLQHEIEAYEQNKDNRGTIEPYYAKNTSNINNTTVRKGKKGGRCRECSNCHTTTTPSWRRGGSNRQLLCNACGLYLKLHGRHRPFSVNSEGKTKAVKGQGEKIPCVVCDTMHNTSEMSITQRGSICIRCYNYYVQEIIAYEVGRESHNEGNNLDNSGNREEIMNIHTGQMGADVVHRNNHMHNIMQEQALQRQFDPTYDDTAPVETMPDNTGNSNNGNINNNPNINEYAVANITNAIDNVEPLAFLADQTTYNYDPTAAFPYTNSVREDTDEHSDV